MIVRMNRGTSKSFSVRSVVRVLMRSVQIVAMVCAMALMGLVRHDCVTNSSGHTAGDPRWIAIPFAAVIGTGLLTLRSSAHRWLAGVLMFFGAFGTGFGFFLDATGIERQYEAWIVAGMPGQNPWAIPLATAYVLVSLLGSLAGPGVMAALRENRRHNR